MTEIYECCPYCGNHPCTCSDYYEEWERAIEESESEIEYDNKNVFNSSGIVNNQ